VLLLEFGSDFLRLSETSITPNGIQLNHISRIQLPPEALERGVPADPKKMAGLLQQICEEKKIRAHRVAVVLPPEVGFQRIVNLPIELSTHEAREYVQDAKNGIQIPFPLSQTDFDLSPILLPGKADQYIDQSPYLLTAIPQLLVDRLIETLQIADFELQLLELGFLSQLRAMALDLMILPSHQVDLVLELLPNSSDLLMVTCSGLLAFERLSAIRNFPDPELADDQILTALDAGLSAESFVVNDERYLPLSELDLRVLVSDFKIALQRFYELCPGCEIRCLQLAGINSAHPLLVNLLQESLGLPVQLHRPLLSIGVSGFSLDDVLVQAALGRLVGLGLGLLSREQLLSCPLNSPKSDNKLLAIGIDQLIVDKAASGSISSLPFLPVQPLGAVNQQPFHSLPSLLVVQETDDEIKLTEVVDITNKVVSSLQPKEPVMSELKEEEEWPTIGGAELKEEVMSEVKEVEITNRKNLRMIDLSEQKVNSDDGLSLITGLESDPPNPSKKKSSKTIIDDSSSTSDSLGELRFSDDD
jgi:Tfp pilus assembly PilM family ATPase